jgi:hypothetical protein
MNGLLAEGGMRRDHDSRMALIDAQLYAIDRCTLEAGA